MALPAVELDHPVVLGPVQVGLPAVQVEVDQWPREPFGIEEAQHALLEARPDETRVLGLVDLDERAHASDATLAAVAVARRADLDDVERVELLGALERLGQPVGMLGGRDVDERALQRGDRDAVQLRAVVGVHAPLVGDEAGQPAPGLLGRRHMDLRAVIDEDAVSGARGPVREVGVRPGSQRPRHAPAVQRQRRVTERVDARVQPYQAPGSAPPRHHPPRQPELVQLPRGHDSVLPRCEPRHAPSRF
jgi:hypothetical protein